MKNQVLCLLFFGLVACQNPGDSNSQSINRNTDPVPAANEDGDSSVPIIPPVPDTLNNRPVRAATIAVFYNQNDPQSIAVKDYYLLKRGIPLQNIISVSIPVSQFLEAATFRSVIVPALAALPPTINAIAITWTKPYVVKDSTVGTSEIDKPMMSITSAFTFGISPEVFKPRSGYQVACVPVSAYPQSPLYDVPSQNYFQNLALRPAMMIAGVGSSQDAAILNAKALIDREVASDRTNPTFNALLVRTSNDPRSNPRQPDFEWISNTYPPIGNGDSRLNVDYVNNDNGGSAEGNFPINRSALMAYETGHWCVPDIRDNAGLNSFLPGAFATHLTSYGGAVTSTVACDVNSGNSPQMSLMRWIEAGATAASGTVREPCAFADKYPKVSIAIKHYLQGETILEAYLKSVRIPYELILVGGPLAAPYR